MLIFLCRSSFCLLFVNFRRKNHTRKRRIQDILHQAYNGDLPEQLENNNNDSNDEDDDEEEEDENTTVTDSDDGSSVNCCLKNLRTFGANLRMFINFSRLMRKPTICICENKDADQITAKLISAFVFATRIVYTSSSSI